MSLDRYYFLVITLAKLTVSALLFLIASPWITRAQLFRLSFSGIIQEVHDGGSLGKLVN